MELKCTFQKYDWGKLGMTSKVASLFKNANPDFVVEESTPYAELWMGTHINGPSSVKKFNQSLSEYITNNPICLGESVIKTFGNDLPYLFKVLSVNKALSVQMHPAKDEAEKLHSEKPDLYKDPNHKPEMAIALTNFEALCGFRPVSEIKHFLNEVPEFKAVVEHNSSELDLFLSNNDDSECHCALKSTFKAFMTCPQDQISLSLGKLLKRFSTANDAVRTTQLASLLERLNSQFPEDVGCFAIYFFNFLSLKPGQAIFLGPNVPHAYLSGDCIECMACSDNVVRAGLTPKFKDVETLCSLVICDSEPADAKIFKSIVEDQYTKIFRPPVPDFAIVNIEIPAGVKNYSLIMRTSASILLVVDGSTETDLVPLKAGSVLFIAAHQTVTIRNVCCQLMMFQAIANV